MAATHASIVRRVLRDLEALPADASKASIEDACVPLRDLFTSFEGLPAAERRRRHRRVTGLLEYRRLNRLHARLTNRAHGLL